MNIGAVVARRFEELRINVDFRQLDTEARSPKRHDRVLEGDFREERQFGGQRLNCGYGVDHSILLCRRTDELINELDSGGQLLVELDPEILMLDERLRRDAALRKQMAEGRRAAIELHMDQFAAIANQVAEFDFVVSEVIVQIQPNVECRGQIQMSGGGLIRNVGFCGGF
jgi:hypothetical protein